MSFTTLYCIFLQSYKILYLYNIYTKKFTFIVVCGPLLSYLIKMLEMLVSTLKLLDMLEALMFLYISNLDMRKLFTMYYELQIIPD